MQNFKLGGNDKSHQFMDDFMRKLENGELKKETCPQVEDGFVLSQKQIEVKSYQKLLKSGILDLRI